MRTVYIDTAAIKDRPSFHATFQEALGFPGFYGKNMDAWIDCMSAVDDPEAELSAVTVAPGEILMLELADSLELAARCPDIWEDLIDAVVFVNQRRVDAGDPAVLALLLR